MGGWEGGGCGAGGGATEITGLLPTWFSELSRKRKKASNDAQRRRGDCRKDLVRKHEDDGNLNGQTLQEVGC